MAHMSKSRLVKRILESDKRIKDGPMKSYIKLWTDNAENKTIPELQALESEARRYVRAGL